MRPSSGRAPDEVLPVIQVLGMGMRPEPAFALEDDRLSAYALSVRRVAVAGEAVTCADIREVFDPSQAVF